MILSVMPYSRAVAIVAAPRALVAGDVAKVTAILWAIRLQEHINKESAA